MQPDCKLLPEKGAATWLGLPISTVRTLRQHGELEFLKIGRRYFYDTTDLMKWVERTKDRNASY